MALPGDHASLIKRALTQLATLFEWRSSHVIGDDHDDRYYTETEVDSLISGIPLTNPGGSNRQVQFNDSGSFGGSSSFTFTSAGNVSTTGYVTARSAGADGGIVLGQAYASGYVGLRTSGMSETSTSEYVVISDGTHTYFSSGTGGTTHLRGPANASTHQVRVTSSGVIFDGTSTAAGLFTASGGLLATGTVGAQLRIRDTNSSDASGYIAFENNAGTRMGYIGYGDNDDIHIKNENTGGNIFFNTQNTWRAYFNTAGHFVPYTNNTYDLGGGTLFWRNAYIAGPIYMGANDYIQYVDAENKYRFVADNTTYWDIYPGRIRVLNTGWTTLGVDGTWGRLETDRGKFYINKEIWVDEGIIGSYNEDLKLRRAGTDRIICTTSQIKFQDEMYSGHQLIINNGSPTIRLQDTNHKSAFLHCNSNIMYILRSSTNNGTGWTAHNGIWPVYWNLNNNDCVMGGQLYVQNMVGTWSFNTVRFGTGGILYKYLSLREIKTDITEINPLLDYLGERSLLYDLNPVIFREADDRINAEGEQFYTTRGEYAPGFIAEEVHEVAPELSIFGDDGELESYSNDALIPHIVAELQRLTPMIESLHSAANPDWDPPVARSVDRGVTEKNIYDVAAARAKANPIVHPNPKNLAEEEEDDE